MFKESKMIKNMDKIAKFFGYFLSIIFASVFTFFVSALIVLHSINIVKEIIIAIGVE